jgi:hypothetical protein
MYGDLHVSSMQEHYLVAQDGGGYPRSCLKRAGGGKGWDINVDTENYEILLFVIFHFVFFRAAPQEQKKVSD